MKTLPSNLTSVMAQAVKEPRYALRFFAVESLQEFPFSLDFATGPILSATQTYSVLMDQPRGNAQTVEPEMGRSTIGQFQFGLLDRAFLATQYISNPGAGLTTAISDTSQTIPASMAVPLSAVYPPFGTVELRGYAVTALSTQPISAGNATIPASAALGLTKNFLSAGHFTLTSVVGAGLTAAVDNSVTVIPASLAGGLTASYLGSGFVQVDSEFISYVALTNSQFGTPSSGATRGALGSTAASHAAPSSCQQGRTETIYYATLTDSQFGTVASPVSRGVAGSLALLHSGVSSIQQAVAERIRYITVTGSTIGSTTSPVSRGVDGTKALVWLMPNSVQNGEQIRPGARAQLFVGDDSVPFSAFASWTRMEVFARGRANPPFYDFTCQDPQRYLRRYAFLGAAQPTNSGDFTVIRSGKPLELLLQVWTTTSGGGNGAYDYGDGNGAGMPTRLVETNSIIALQSLFFPNDIYVYKFREPIDIKAWSEELLRGLNCFASVTQSGTLSVRRYAASASSMALPVASLTMDNIIGIPQWSPGDSSIANIISVLYDWGTADRTSDYATNDLFADTESIRLYGRRAAQSIKLPGARTLVVTGEIGSGAASQVLSASAMAQDRATLFLQRFSQPLDVLNLDAHYSLVAVEPGDVVTVTHSWVPDIWGAGMGVSAMPFEVANVRPIFNPAEGPPHTQLQLLRLRASGPPLPQGTFPLTPIHGGVEICSGHLGARHVRDGAFTQEVATTDVTCLGQTGASSWTTHIARGITTIGGAVFLSAQLATFAAVQSASERLQVRVVQNSTTVHAQTLHIAGDGAPNEANVLVDLAFFDFTAPVGVNTYSVQLTKGSDGGGDFTTSGTAFRTEAKLLTLTEFLR